MEAARTDKAVPGKAYPTGKYLLGCLGMIGVVAFLGSLGSLSSRSTPKYDEQQLVTDLNTSSQLSALRDAGIVQQVQSFGTGVSVVIGPSFYSISFEQKASPLRNVSAIVGASRGGDHFILYDWRTDKRVGSWSEQYGLKLE